MFLHSILIKQVPVIFNIYTEITLDLFWDLMKHQLLHFDFFFKLISSWIYFNITYIPWILDQFFAVSNVIFMHDMSACVNCHSLITQTYWNFFSCIKNKYTEALHDTVK